MALASISRIIIEQQMAAIGVRTTPANLQITTPSPEMTITQENAEFTVESERPTFKVNQKKLRREMNLADPVTFNQELGSKAQQAVHNGIKSKSQEGDFIASVQQQGNRIAMISKQKSIAKTKKAANIALMPPSKPEIEWNPGYVRINWSGHNVKIEWEGEYMPEMVVDPPYSVEVFLLREPQFRITVEPGDDPYQPGQRVDAQL
ncbi:MAG: DUF6470 family protein [Oscillospiraceae bacterium]|jgi:hypothetical protein|nr:DUF6470 family protein [Oscillospiraceae bacterium]